MTLTPARDSTFLLPVTLKRLIQERLPILLLSPGSQLVKIIHFPVALRLSWVTSPVLFLVIVLSLFSCSAEIQLQRADTEFNKSIMLLIPQPKLRSDIAEGMAEEIFRYAAYPLCSE